MANPALLRNSAPQDEEELVRVAGRALRPAWNLYPGCGRLRLVLRDPAGLLPPLTATADVAWICREDEIVLRDAHIAAALARAGIVREPCTPLRGGHGALLLARLTAAALARLPRQVFDSAA